MLGIKLLRNPCALLGKNILQVKNSGTSVRGSHIVAVPPRNKISVGEKIFYFTVIGVSMWFVPFWVLYHIPDYQKENRNEYTGK